MDTTEVLRLIKEGHERTDVEYKRSMAWEGEGRYKILKAIMAFANCGGGYIVIGYDECLRSLEERFTGVEEHDLETWDVTKISRDVNNYTGPPIDVELLRVEDDETGHSYIAIRVPSHGATPHVCAKDKHVGSNLILRRGCIYYRNRNKECSEISTPSDWAELINRCTLARSDELLRHFEHILKGIRAGALESTERDLDPFEEMDSCDADAKDFRPKNTKQLVAREVIGYPAGEWSTTDIQTVKEALSRACVDYRGWPFVFFYPQSRVAPKYMDDFIYAYNNEPFYGRLMFDYWRLDHSKGLFYSQNLTAESSREKPLCFDPSVEVRSIAEAIIAMGRIFSTIGVQMDQEIVFAVKYSPVNGARVESFNPDTFHLTPSKEYRDTQVSLTRRARLSLFLNDVPRLASKVTLDLVSKMGYERQLPDSVLVQFVSKHLSNEVKTRR